MSEMFESLASRFAFRCSASLNMTAPVRDRPRCHSWLIRFWRKRGNDFFKSRVATQRVPKRQQLQLAVASAIRKPAGRGKLFASQIIVTDPRSDHRQIPDHGRAVDCVPFSTGRSSTARRPRGALPLCVQARRRSSRAGRAPDHDSLAPGRFFSCSARAAANSNCALASSFVMRAVTPSRKRRVKGTFSPVRVGLFSPNAFSACLLHQRRVRRVRI